LIVIVAESFNVMITSSPGASTAMPITSNPQETLPMEAGA
jgi:hypothetical protein